MTGRTLHGWTDAWRVFWSFLWRQALLLFAASSVLGAFVGLGRQFGLLPAGVITTMLPWASGAMLIYSCVHSFRLLLAKYEVRAPGAHAHEQDRHHRR